MRLDEIEARWKATTEGEWRCDVRTGCIAVYAGEKRTCFADWRKNSFIAFCGGEWTADGWVLPDSAEADLAFIAAAHEDVPYLIACVRGLDNPWISVEEGLPESYVAVLVSCDNARVYQGWYDGRKDRWYIAGHMSSVPVTHWMPVPKPPVESE